MSKTPAFIKLGDGHADITFERQVTIAGAKVTTLRMREPMVKDMRAMSKQAGGNEEQEAFLMGNLLEVSPADLDEMHLKEYKRLQTALMLFIG